MAEIKRLSSCFQTNSSLQTLISANPTDTVWNRSERNIYYFTRIRNLKEFIRICNLNLQIFVCIRQSKPIAASLKRYAAGLERNESTLHRYIQPGNFLHNLAHIIFANIIFVT